MCTEIVEYSSPDEVRLGMCTEIVEYSSPDEVRLYVYGDCGIQ